MAKKDSNNSNNNDNNFFNKNKTIFPILFIVFTAFSGLLFFISQKKSDENKIKLWQGFDENFFKAFAEKKNFKSILKRLGIKSEKLEKKSDII